MVNLLFTPDRLRTPAARLLLILAGITLSLLLLEGLVRLLPPPYETDAGALFACHDSLGWTGAPFYQGVLEQPEFRQALVFNSLGMHDTEHTLAPPPNTFRILMLGDSFVQAVQVDEAASAHQVLENSLNAGPDGPGRFEVISGGVVNWGTNQQLLYYRQQGRAFRPDLTVLMFYLGNDLRDNLPGNGLTIQGFNCYAPYFAMCEKTLNSAPLAYAPGLSRLEGNCGPARRLLISSLGWLYRHSRLYRQLDPLLVSRYPRQIFGAAYPQSFAALYLPEEESELTQAWQVTLATIAQLRQEVEADGGRFAVVLISPDVIVRLALLSPAEQAVFRQDNPLFAQAQLNRPNRRLAAFLDEQGIPFLDLAPVMVKQQAHLGLPLHFIREGGHWTAAGNRVAGEALAGWLKQAGLLP